MYQKWKLDPINSFKELIFSHGYIEDYFVYDTVKEEYFKFVGSFTGKEKRYLKKIMALKLKSCFFQKVDTRGNVFNDYEKEVLKMNSFGIRQCPTLFANQLKWDLIGMDKREERWLRKKEQQRRANQTTEDASQDLRWRLNPELLKEKDLCKPRNSIPQRQVVKGLININERKDELFSSLEMEKVCALVECLKERKRDAKWEQITNKLNKLSAVTQQNLVQEECLKDCPFVTPNKGKISSSSQDE